MNDRATFTLELITGEFAITRTRKEGNRLTSSDGNFVAVIDEGNVRTHIGPTSSTPAESTELSKNWRALRIRGPLSLSDSGILAPLLEVIAAARASVLVVSSFDTDTLLVQHDALAAVMHALRAAGHRVTQESPSSWT